MKNYTLVHLKYDKKLMPLLSLSKIDSLLTSSGRDFIQIHRSFLVARKCITAIGPNSVTLNKTELPIGIQYKERFFRAIGMKD